MKFNGGHRTGAPSINIFDDQLCYRKHDEYDTGLGRRAYSNDPNMQLFAQGNQSERKAAYSSPELISSVSFSISCIYIYINEEL